MRFETRNKIEMVKKLTCDGKLMSGSFLFHVNRPDFESGRSAGYLRAGLSGVILSPLFAGSPFRTNFRTTFEGSVF